MVTSKHFSIDFFKESISHFSKHFRVCPLGITLRTSPRNLRETWGYLGNSSIDFSGICSKDLCRNSSSTYRGFFAELLSEIPPGTSLRISPGNPTKSSEDTPGIPLASSSIAGSGMSRTTC